MARCVTPTLGTCRATCGASILPAMHHGPVRKAQRRKRLCLLRRMQKVTGSQFPRNPKWCSLPVVDLSFCLAPASSSRMLMSLPGISSRSPFMRFTTPPMAGAKSQAAVNLQSGRLARTAMYLPFPEMILRMAWQIAASEGGMSISWTRIKPANVSSPIPWLRTVACFSTH